MKRNILLAALFVALFMACNDDENTYDNYWYDLGVYEITGEGSTDFIINLDKGEILLPTEITGSLVDYEDGTRVKVSYSRLENGPNANEINAAIHYIDDVLTKDVVNLTDKNADSIGNSPIHVHKEDIWIAKNYLNILFSYWGQNQTHYLNLIKYPNDSIDSNGRLILEFRHNDNDDYPAYAYNGVVSFDMNSLYKLGLDSLPIVLKVKEYNSDSVLWTGTYYFDSEEKSTKQIDLQNESFLMK